MASRTLVFPAPSGPSRGLKILFDMSDSFLFFSLLFYQKWGFGKAFSFRSL